MTDTSAQTLRTARIVITAGAIVLALSFGVRHGFGLFLQPISMSNGWGRETFALSIALQNLIWGASQPFVGMVSDRYGPRWVIAGGALCYIAGLIAMSLPLGPTAFVLTSSTLIGLGLSGTTFPVIFAAISRVVPPEKLSMAMGLTMAVASFGQFAMMPLTLGLIGGVGWSTALVILSALVALILPLAFFMSGKSGTTQPRAEGPGVIAALREAMAVRDFHLLFLGFFVCGFQVVFIGVHLPAFFADEGLAPGVATMVLALVGLFNIIGSYSAGLLGGKHSKPHLLAWLYLLRGLTIAVFFLLPITQTSALIFGMVMGLFWLSTVPLTNGIIASVFGSKNMAMLGGIVFFGHQLGSFFGGWLGGYLYDRTGSYDVVWWIAIALSLMAALLNMPIRETPMALRRALGVARP